MLIQSVAMNAMQFKAFVLTVCLLVPVSSFAWDPFGIHKPIDAVNARIDEMSKIIERQLNAGITAVPGERWLRHIDNINAPCEKIEAQKKQACLADKAFSQAFLANVAKISGIDVAGTYQVSVWIESTDGKPLPEINVDTFATTIPNPADYSSSTAIVQNWLDKKKFNPNSMVGGSRELMRPLTSSEIDATITKAANQIFQNEFSSGVAVKAGVIQGGLGPPTDGWAFNPGLLDTVVVACYLPTAPQQRECVGRAYQERSEAFAKALRTAIMAPYASVPREATAMRITKKWDVLSEDEHLVIVVKNDDWQKIKGRVRISAVVHKSNDVQTRHELSRTYTFLPAEFDTSKSRPSAIGYGEMVWAAHSMLDAYVLPRDVNDQLARARAELQKLREAQKDSRQR